MQITRPTLRIDTTPTTPRRKRYDAAYEAVRENDFAKSLPEYIRSTSLADAASELDLPGYWNGPLPDGAYHVGHMHGMTQVGISHVAVLNTYGDPVAIYVNRHKTDIGKCEDACVALGSDSLYC